MKSLLTKRHVQKHGRSHYSVPFSMEKRQDNTASVEADYYISPLKGVPYANRVKLFGVAKGNYMIVHEIMGSSQLVNSSFVETLVGITKFHPEKAHKAYIAEKKAGKRMEEVTEEE